jgi:hypothetical protein
VLPQKAGSPGGTQELREPKRKETRIPRKHKNARKPRSPGNPRTQRNQNIQTARRTKGINYFTPPPTPDPNECTADTYQHGMHDQLQTPTTICFAENATTGCTIFRERGSESEHLAGGGGSCCDGGDGNTWTHHVIS